MKDGVPATAPQGSPVQPGIDAAAWLRDRGWQPFPFQRELWQAIADGRSGLLHASTGSGKTYAVWLGALMRWGTDAASRGRLTVLWLTPMRALAADTGKALQAALPALAPHWRLGVRTGDTGAAERAAQARKLPEALITTPESLSQLLARERARELLSDIRLVVVDEWHELLGNKRGVQVQLALARLRRWQPRLHTWGLSATLGNLGQAMTVLLGPAAASSGLLVRADVPRPLLIDTLLPPAVERFPYAGHLGLVMLPAVIAQLEPCASALVFTNTRAQCELWYQALLQARPDWAGSIALHHSAIDAATREWVESALKDGRLKAVVCTSSLDLGVDFSPVERVLQIGSAKGIARLMQRAGRSGHAPGRPSRLTLVPTHSLEIIEGAAARAAVAAGRIEDRIAPGQPLDVLVQHLVTIALGGGFRPDELFDEIRQTAAYAGLDAGRWQWALDFVHRGGPSLTAYPDYRRVTPAEQGVGRAPDARLARRHRANIGTIVGDVEIVVQYLRGPRLGTIEERFIARLRPGDRFLFAGRTVELVRVHLTTAYVRRAPDGRAAVPRWAGGRMPLSSHLAAALVEQMTQAADGRFDSPELQCARPLLQLQARWSRIPRTGSLLAEILRTREGWHLFLYPFAGRLVHAGLASLIAYRVSRDVRGTFSIAVNDYGLELLSATPIDWRERLTDALAPPSPTGPTLIEEILDSLNAGEMAQRRFREIARIAGLIFQSYPGEPRSARQLQASASLFWDVFRKFDPGNRLLAQAIDELLAQELDAGRLRQALDELARRTLEVVMVERPTPFGFPLIAERMRERFSNEAVAERLARMIARLERAADEPAARRRR